METVSLFGGAMQAQFPARLVDVSDFRPVPDHQEVFSDGSNDQSLVFEILEYGRNLSDPGTFYFEDLAQANQSIEGSAGVESKEIQLEKYAPVLFSQNRPNIRAWLCTGRMAVQKFQDTQAVNKVHVHLAVIRIPDKDTDILISLNTPVFIHEQSSSAKYSEAGYMSHDTIEQADALFATVLQTYTILDWSLFGS
jgi:hypothetical protein